jgi:hypothetical protein
VELSQRPAWGEDLVDEVGVHDPYVFEILRHDGSTVAASTHIAMWPRTRRSVQW